MIQRLQTLFLLGVSICMGMVFSYYIWGERIDDQNRVASLSAISLTVIDTAGTFNDVSDDTVIESKSTWYIGALAALAAITALVSIFQFKNRLTQMKLGALNSLFMVATLGASFFLIRQAEGIFPESQGSPQLAFYLPIAGLLLNMVSNRMIRKDEQLVKSVDRIR